MKRVVLLNASGEVLGQVPVHRAVTFLVHGRAVGVGDTYLDVYRHGSGQIPIAHVVRLLEHVDTPETVRAPVWSRAGVRRRDGEVCAYCGGYGDTVDHIKPRAQGGPNTWLNTVTACGPCNSRKDNRTPGQAGMRLLYTPTVPKPRKPYRLRGVTAEQLATLAEHGLNPVEPTPVGG